MRLHNRLLACAVVVSLFPGCRSGAPPPPVTGIPPDAEMKEMGKLAFLAYVGDNLKGSDPKVEQELVGCMNTALADQAPDWKLVWGPGVYHFDSTGLDDNMMYVVQNGKTPAAFAVVVRGTNPDALLNWLVEDLDFIDQVAWPGSPSGQAKISKGTSEGLHILQEMTAIGNLPAQSARMSLTQFLAGEPGLRRLYVTGHSLGGALSPALALWLQESQAQWDPEKRVEIRVYPLAGPTAGNADFATYYDQGLGPQTRRMWNPFDVVPLAWNHETMGKMEDLYEPFTRANPPERGLIDGLRSLAKDKGYTQIDVTEGSLSGKVPTTYPDSSHDCQVKGLDWLSEVGWQHHWGYQCALGILINPSIAGCPSKTLPPCAGICGPPLPTASPAPASASR